MSVRLEGVVIHRPIEDVFAFFSDFENSPLWGRTIKTAKDSDGPASVGTIFLEEAKIMGRMMKHRSEVTEFDPPTKFFYANRFENGISEQARFTFESIDGGTRMNPASDVEMKGVPQILAPFFTWQMKRQVRALFKNLKDVLESPDRPVV
jgi:hypothetical protein